MTQGCGPGFSYAVCCAYTKSCIVICFYCSIHSHQRLHFSCLYRRYSFQYFLTLFFSAQKQALRGLLYCFAQLDTPLFCYFQHLSTYEKVRLSSILLFIYILFQYVFNILAEMKVKQFEKINNNKCTVSGHGIVFGCHCISIRSHS